MKMKKLGGKCAMFLLLVSLIGSSFGTVYGASADGKADAADKAQATLSASAEPSDISGHWAEKQLLEWRNKGLVQGYSDGTFKPDNPITRGELIALINRAMGFKDKAPISFTDLKPSDWAYDNVAIAVKAGYIQGNADGTIGAKREISRQETALMISRLMKLDNKSAAADAFDDSDQIAKWAKAAVGAVSDKKIMVGFSNGSFRPKSSMKRAEAIVVLDRVISMLEDQQEPTTTPAASATPVPTGSPVPTATPGPAATLGPTASPEPTPAYGTVTGHVYGTDNIGIEGATVTLSGSVSKTTTTIAAGAFSFNDVPIGNYTIIVSKDNYSDGISSALNVTSGAASDVNVTIEPGQNLDVVENSQANAVIVVDDANLSSAASIMAEYVKKSTGADLPILTTAQLTASGTQYDGDVRVYIGSGAPGTEAVMAFRLQSLSDDGFVIMPYRNTLSISGPNDWGTEIGVYEFLERYVGVRWLMPGPDGEDVPLHDDIIIPFRTVIDEPAVMSRHFFGTEAWYTLQTTADWAKYNRMHDVVKFHHYLNVLFDPKVFANNPEYYPGGVVPTHPYAWQPCFNDDTADAAIWRIKDFFNNFPEEKSFSLGINDSNNYCASDIARTNGKINSIGIPDMSDVYYSWVNQVVEGVLEEYPDKYFGLLAYWNVYDPPTTKLNSHVIPYITDDRMSWIDPDIETIGNELTERWQQKADNIGFYEYLFGNPYNLPRVYMNKMAEAYKYAEEHGVKAHVAELYPNFGEGPKPWLSAKLQWNSDQDVDLLLSEWYERTVGVNAASDLKAYYDLWENFWTDRVFETSWYLNWKNSATRPNYLNLLDHSYLTAVTKEDLSESRRLLESVVAKAITAKQKVRAEKLLRAFELYEASALSYPRGAVDAPTNEQDAIAMLDDLKQSFDMAMKRQVITQQFKGDPILNLTTYAQYAGKWDGVQEGLIDALESYANTITDPNSVFLADFQQVLAYLDSLNQYTATAVKTTATKAQILAALDFSQGPWVNAEPITEFLNMTSTEAPPGETRMYLLWDDSNLYVGYENFDPDMSGVIVNDDAPGGWWRVADDSVETYVTGDVSAGYTGFFTNPKAVKFIYNSSPTGPVPGVNNSWETSAEMKADRWNVIQVIPFSSIGVDPSVSKTLMGFFFRNYHGQSMFLGWGGGAPWNAKSFRPVHLVEGNNLITNPSIESSVVDQPWLASDWYVRFLGDGSTTLRSSTLKRSGSFSLETSVVSSDSSPFKVIPIAPGKYKAVLSYYVPMDSNTSGKIQIVTTIRKDDVNLAESKSVERPVSWMPGRWVQFEHIFEIASDYNGEVPDDIIFTINHSGFSLGEKLYIDDVYLYKLTN
ncbi:DUF4838 domain-containing protein [Paenibacillus sp. PAMC21692]|uniref:DUF4838 domain-containing protein n=1 Tax=Paenibacillus sp. PAMC21692 TaxID=2762320 RepID=UPI00164D83A7|nr:DUF4838 domain-containing protein [Paenibacillus sp. PAMC21692]QNK58966.1 DUF4838 domain-containing protein [Paenibacillus sp. PAMC21692]